MILRSFAVLLLTLPAAAAPRWKPVAERGGVLRAGPVFGVFQGNPMVSGGCLVGHCDYGDPSNFIGSPQLLEAGEWGSLPDTPGVRFQAAGGVVGGKFVLHGGKFSELGKAGVSAETWSFDGTTWHKLAGTNHPGPRFGAAFAVDPTGTRAYLFGGRDDVNADSDETWTWSAGAWMQASTGGTIPEQRVFGAMAWDGAKFVYFGGQDSFPSDDLYALECEDPVACTWTAIPHDGPWPGARAQHAMAWDPKRHAAVLFGGLVDGHPANDVWEWNGTRWAQINAGTGPKARYGHAMALDEPRGRVLVLGGATGTAAPSIDDLWEYVDPDPPDAGTPVTTPDAGSTEEGVDAGGAPEDAPDAGTPGNPGDSEDPGDHAPKARYGCHTAAPAALVLLPLAIARLRRRRRH